eukprot:gene859-1178_t
MQPVSAVVVVGAGIAGLQAARALLKRDLHVLVLEERSDIGGVWTGEYPGFGVQVGYRFYELPEFPWPVHLRSLAPTPTHKSVHAYLHEYAQHFGLLQRVRFGCRMMHLLPLPGGRWSVTYLERSSGALQTLSADHVIIATGMYSLANVPVYKGMQHFKGQQLHTKDFKAPSLAQGKKVVVVGAGRSALDCAGMVAASNIAASVTWLFRQPHWPIPPKLGNGLTMPGLIFSRLPSHLLAPYYTASAAQQAAHTLTAPAKRAVWNMLQRSITNHFGMAASLLPAMSLDADLLYAGQVIDAQWNKVLLESVKMRNGLCICLKPVPSPAAAEVSSKNTQQQQEHSTQHQARQRLCSMPGCLQLPCAAPDADDPDSYINDKAGCWWCRRAGKRQCAAASAPSLQQQAAAEPNPLVAASSETHELPKVGSYGSIVQPQCGEIESFGEDYVCLRSGEAIAADLVLYATGYSKSYDYLDAGPRAKLGIQKDGLPLFRNILPPLLPGLAFIGAEVSTYNNVLTFGLQAEWLADVLLQRVKLPNRQAMQADVQQLNAWRRRVFPPHRNRAAGVQLYMEQYHAQLLRDRGLRVPKPAWLLQPLAARDYSYAFKATITRQPALRPGLHKADGCYTGAKSLAAAVEQAQAAVAGSICASPLLPPEAVAEVLRASSANGPPSDCQALQSGTHSNAFEPQRPASTQAELEAVKAELASGPCDAIAGFSFFGPNAGTGNEECGGVDNSVGTSVGTSTEMPHALLAPPAQ